jgi:signal recognition particle subunit SRP54
MGMPGMPGMGGMGGSKKAKGRAQQQQAKKKSRSGNPAKRAIEESAPAAGTGLPAGLDGFDPAAFDPSMLDPEALKKMGDLPPAFKDLLK